MSAPDDLDQFLSNLADQEGVSLDEAKQILDDDLAGVEKDAATDYSADVTQSELVDASQLNPEGLKIPSQEEFDAMPDAPEPEAKGPKERVPFARMTCPVTGCDTGKGGTPREGAVPGIKRHVKLMHPGWVENDGTVYNWPPIH
jgi:hypothetical protein